MIGFSTLSVLFNNLFKTGLTDKIFHSVIIRNDGTGQQKPSAPVENKFVYCGIDDTKGFTAYCRAVGPLEYVKETALGACSKVLVRTQILHRLVFYNANEQRAQDGITAQVINAILSTPQTKFFKAYTNAESFIRQEQPTGNFNLSPNSYYFAIDFFLFLNLSANNCSSEIACSIDNPICSKS